MSASTLSQSLPGGPCTLTGRTSPGPLTCAEASRAAAGSPSHTSLPSASSSPAAAAHASPSSPCELHTAREDDQDYVVGREPDEAEECPFGCSPSFDNDGFSEIDEPGDTQVIYVREAVSVWPTRRDTIEGRLTLIKQHQVMFLAWLPYTLGTLNQDGTFSVLPDNGASKTAKMHSASADRTMYAVHPIPLSEIKAITKHTPTLGWHYLCVVLVSGLTLPPLYFNNGGVRAFLCALKEHAFLIKSSEDPNTYLVNDTVDPLQRSLTHLELTDVLLGAPPPGASSTFPPLHGDLAASWCTGQEARLPHGSQPYAASNHALSSMSMHIIDQFSRVARMARDTTSSLFVSPDECGFRHGHGSPLRAPPSSLPRKLQEPAWKASCRASSRPSSACSDQTGSSETADTSVGLFELVEQQVDMAAASRKRARPPPLGLEDWSAFLDSEGRLKNESLFRERVFYSGVSPALRKEAWKFLLQLYPADSTAAERANMAVARSEEYEVLKRQWSSISGKQAACFSKWRERLTRVEKDVHRTDRSHPCFSGEGSAEHLAQLRAILLTYCMYNFDLGYCQGMSDLAAPILVVMQNEADAFWCFVALMDRMQSNFHTDQTGMHSQLLALCNLVELLDPEMHAFLRDRDSLNFFFCFRWVLIQFKREFEFDQVLRLWEALWSRHLSDHFHLYVCVAVLEHYRRAIMQEHMAFDDILKFCIELSGRIDLDCALRDAQQLLLYAGEAGRECLAGLP